MMLFHRFLCYWQGHEPQYVELDAHTLREAEAFTAREMAFSEIVAVHRPDPVLVARAKLFAERERRIEEMHARSGKIIGARVVYHHFAHSSPQPRGIGAA
jgi:hypothetical protein